VDALQLVEIVYDFDGGRLTSDAGVPVLSEIERRLGLAERLAACLNDPRSPDRMQHGLAEMIRFRMLMIAAAYWLLHTLRGLPSKRSARNRKFKSPDQTS